MWQTDRENTDPFGEPQMIISFTQRDQTDLHHTVGERDQRFGTDYKRKQQLRKDIAIPRVPADSDAAWKRRNSV